MKRTWIFFPILKIRAGYGVTGNDKIPDYQFVSGFTANAVYGLGNGSVIGYTPSLANAALKWEVNTTRNIGFDAAFLKNRLTLTMDVYKNTGTNLLIYVPSSHFCWLSSYKRVRHSRRSYKTSVLLLTRDLKSA